ncbi:hypothetical protein ASPWEDRAFT_40591 [Aspergillus wentii DTO 134E9]|uniref:Rhodopsin domain-containing protein n=1 Tax=Aspergillus wentii DTO 134E9 TaxID=1073089 RepID=A0A1L9RKF4_ASPWE|nr:uncharacterized protein ASPWEDRAFT_40591 [Aspergillus wentii DTO 134E9]OJJ35395.1 hypothetical protein ASPWEDRAFT_40591 [Aspergillus wentii DTO 134E9]
MSLLALYLRIFPNRSLRLAVFICMAILTLSVLITVPMAIWQCNPISATWRVTERRHAHCLSLRQVAYANAGVNIATELAVFIIPIPVLRKLQTTPGKKIALYVLLGMGVLYVPLLYL